MLNFLTLKPTSFGLDISDLSLKIIQLKKKGRLFDLSAFGETKMKAGIIEQGEIKNEKALIQHIKKATSSVKGSIKTNYVVASLPEEKAFLQVIQLPMMAVEEARKAVYFEAENYIPLPINKVYLDSQVISKSKGHLNVLIAALPKDTVDPYVRSLKGAGLKIAALEIESMSISRALVNQEINKEPFLLIDLGENRTSLIIFFDSSLRFTTSCQICSKNFTRDIADALDTDLKRAESYKIRYGITDTPQGNEIAKAIKPTLEDLTRQTKKYLDYSKGHYDKEIKKVVLCGGGVNLKGFTEFFSSKINVPVELGNPWINILSGAKKETRHLPYQESLRYTTALGLALRGQKYD
ncbi:MAG: type IV pilus assembly protein PilM [Candidatus Nealsonbacteria bacterium]